MWKNRKEKFLTFADKALQTQLSVFRLTQLYYTLALNLFEETLTVEIKQSVTRTTEELLKEIEKYYQATEGWDVNQLCGYYPYKEDPKHQQMLSQLYYALQALDRVQYVRKRPNPTVKRLLMAHTRDVVHNKYNNVTTSNTQKAVHDYIKSCLSKGPSAVYTDIREEFYTTACLIVDIRVRIGDNF